MNALLTLLYLVVCAAIVVFVPPMVTPYVFDYGVVGIADTAKAVLLCTVLALIPAWYSFRQLDGRFLLRLFIMGLILRMLLGTLIFAFNGQQFFGGDAMTFDVFGMAQLQAWGGDKYSEAMANRFVGGGLTSGWGMVYFVAAVYALIGRNPLAIQLINSVLGAATAVIIYLSAHHVFNNLRVARFAGIAVAFYPSLVLWSSQGLKDAPIVFCLAVSIFATLKLGEKLSIKYLTVLCVSLFLLLTLRFYIFYMLTAAVAGAFIIGMQAINAASFLRQTAALLLIGLVLTYVGVTQSATIQLEQFGNLQRLQQSRSDLATSAESGFGKDVDVSTTSGALSTIPLGLLYLLFAPFPWQVVSLRQSITIPEMVIWWASFPLLILGLWFTIKHRLRPISPILIFTVMLTFAYSIFQGNVGTAYRQRSQLLVFYFIFVAVGLVLLQEKRAEKKRLELASRREFAAQQAATEGARSLRRPQ